MSSFESLEALVPGEARTSLVWEILKFQAIAVAFLEF